MPDIQERRLRWAAALFAAGSAVHLFDHLRRGQTSVTEQLYWSGTFALVLQVTLITLVATRHRLAPLVAVGVGFPLALGFATAHWLPDWSPLSDPLWDIPTWPVLSYVASGLEVIGALAVGLAGLAIVRKRGLASFANPSRDAPAERPGP